VVNAEARKKNPAGKIAHVKTADGNPRLLTFIFLTLSFVCLAGMQEMSGEEQFCSMRETSSLF